jgi:hypothetical protein
MEWLTQMLGMGNQQSSPFGALSSKLGGMMPQMGGQPGQPPGAPPMQPGAPPPMQAGGALPFMGPQGQPSAAPGAPAAPAQQPGLWGGQNQQGGALMGQAMNLMKQPQMQQPQWMPWMGK